MTEPLCTVVFFTKRRVAPRVFIEVVDATARVLGARMVRRVDVAIIGDHRMRTLNHRYRGKNQTTDVLSFATQPDPPASRVPRVIEGDIVISLAIAVRQARHVGHSLHEELQRLCVHGLLHLAGYDHMRPADERRMFALEDKILARIV
jgi:probable rRNA maturation factor